VINSSPILTLAQALAKRLTQAVERRTATNPEPEARSGRGPLLLLDCRMPLKDGYQEEEQTVEGG